MKEGGWQSSVQVQSQSSGRHDYTLGMTKAQAGGGATDNEQCDYPSRWHGCLVAWEQQ